VVTGLCLMRLRVVACYKQDMKWLQDAMKSCTVDEAKRMRELLDILRENDDEEGLEAKETAFDELIGLVESIDNARG
jgi:hypothetical protein